MTRRLERSYECADAAEVERLATALRALRSRLIAKAGCDLDDSITENVNKEGAWYEVDLRTPSASRLVVYDKVWGEFMAPKYQEVKSDG